MTGCRCSACYGLTEYLTERGLSTRGLVASEGCGANDPAVVPFEVVACDGSMTCPCERCCAQRQRRRFVKPARQPWEKAA